MPLRYYFLQSVLCSLALLQLVMNWEITAPVVFVVDHEGTTIGEMAHSEALKKAKENKMDLILVNDKRVPPIVKVSVALQLVRIL